MNRTAHPIEPALWMTNVLRLAGLYNLLFGAFAVLFPLLPFQWAGMREPIYPALWQCIGMIVGVYGIGYLTAARDPFRHWPIVLVGLLGKVFGPIGFLDAALAGEIPFSFGWIILLNDLVWWLPFAFILLGAYRHHHPPRIETQLTPLTDSAPVHSLQQMLQTLSAPAQVQQRLFPDLAQRVVQMSGQYDGFLEQAQRDQAGRLLPQQVEPLQRVGAQLRLLAAGGNNTLHTDTALQEAPEWHQLRGLARQALVTFGWSVDVPLSMLRTRENG